MPASHDRRYRFCSAVRVSTLTPIEGPTTVYIDEVTTHSIVAAAYAPGTAFSSMTVGLSGTNVAIGPVYQGWHGERWVSRASIPTPRTRFWYWLM